jgi:hypothetical protein
MSKKPHKRKTSKALTKSTKVMQDQVANNATQQINHSSQYNNKLKKRS